MLELVKILGVSFALIGTCHVVFLSRLDCDVIFDLYKEDNKFQPYQKELLRAVGYHYSDTESITIDYEQYPLTEVLEQYIANFDESLCSEIITMISMAQKITDPQSRKEANKLICETIEDRINSSGNVDAKTADKILEKAQQSQEFYTALAANTQ